MKNLIIIISSIIVIFIFGSVSLLSLENDLKYTHPVSGGIIFGNIHSKASVAESDSVEKTNYISKVWTVGTTLHYKIVFDGPDYNIKIDIYNMLAKPVDTVFDGIANAAQSGESYEFENTYDASSLPPGIYFLKLTGPGFSHVGKFILT